MLSPHEFQSLLMDFRYDAGVLTPGGFCGLLRMVQALSQSDYGEPHTQDFDF